MKLKQIASNMTELHLDNGTIVLFSYETPVAAWTLNCGAENNKNSILKTNKNWSKTTSTHISKWFNYAYRDKFNSPTKVFNAFTPIEVDQSVLDELVSEKVK